MAECGLVLVAAGPSYEPLDEVRRLTNHSTGELGVLLTRHLADAGWPVVCLLGEGASARPEPGLPCRRFGTNDDLLALYREYAATPVAAIFQVAALCDFRVHTIGGAPLGEPKLSSRAGDLHLTLRPATKVLLRLRPLFPAARLIGWKYEVFGTPAEVRACGHRQFAEAGTDLCILNGRAAGPGFTVLAPAGELAHLPAKPALCAWLTHWLSLRPCPEPSPTHASPPHASGG